LMHQDAAVDPAQALPLSPILTWNNRLKIV